jgi:hypothetical protein
MNFLAVDQFPEHAQIWILWTAVVQNRHGSKRKTGDQKIPHHPAGRCEPEKIVPIAQIQVQRQCFQMLKKNAPMPMDDRLRDTRCPR